MMDVHEFIKKIEGEFEDLKPGVLKPDSKIREHFEWDSVNALVFIAMVNVEYDVVITAEELQSAESVQDVFDVIVKKKEA
jgi:acyl carrier protein